MSDNELFGEQHEEEENGLFGKRHTKELEEDQDPLSCCGDVLPDNQICPTCKEHN